MGDRGQTEAWVTLATNDAYALGCLTLGCSLQRVQTTRQKVVMVTEGVSERMRAQLSRVFDRLEDVVLHDSQDERNLALLGRPDLNITFTKMNCWTLVQYQKCVFLDADTLVIRNCDELFDREEFSAAPDAGWPDCFNSGVFVFVPSMETYNNILSFALTTGSFDGGDQGLLNSYFNTWATKDIHKHLPFIYNVVSQAFYSYLPAFEQFKQTIKIVHFIGPIKPWNHPYNAATQRVTVFPETGHCEEFLQFWWDIFMEMVQPHLDPMMGGLVGELAQMKIGGSQGIEGADCLVLDDRERRLAWERGHADYLGADSFDNIIKKIETKMAPTPSPSSSFSSSSGKKFEGDNSSTSSQPPEVNASGGVSSGDVFHASGVVESSVSKPLPVVVQAGVSLAEAVVSAGVAEAAETITLSGSGPPPPASVPVEEVETTTFTLSLSSPPAPEPQPVAPPVPQPAVVAAPAPVPKPKVVAPPVPQPKAVAPPAPQPKAVAAPAPQPKPVAAPAPQPKAVAAPVPETKSVAAPVSQAVSVPEPKSVVPVPAPKAPGVVGKTQGKLTPLQMGKQPAPPTTPEKPSSSSPSSSGGVSPKSPPPSVAQKPSTPVEEAKGSQSAPKPPSVAAQRGLFDKPAAPAPGPTSPAGKAAPGAGGSISAFASRFQQQPPSPGAAGAGQTPSSKPAPGAGPKPTTPTSPGVAAVAPKPTSPFGAAPKPSGAAPGAASAAKPGSAGPSPTTPTSPTSPSGGNSGKNAEFLARYGLKKK